MSPENLDPARSLLVALLSDQPDLSVATDPGKWRIVREHAMAFGVAPLVAYTARSHVSASERAWCDQQLTKSWRRFERAMRDLDFVVSVLTDAGIQAIPLKGPFFAWRHYRPPFLRNPSIDLDLAVRSSDLRRACDALTEVGYRLRAPINDFRTGSHEVALIHDSRVPLELHFRLSHGAVGLPVEAFFARAMPSELLAGRPTWILEPVDELLHLFLHLSSDRFRSFFHLYEFRRIWKSSSIGVRHEVIQRAITQGYAGALALTEVGFRLRWNDSFLPDGVALPKTWLHWRINEDLYRALEGWLTPGRKLKARLRGRWLELQATDSPRAALRHIPILARVAVLRLKRRQWGATAPIPSRPPKTT